MEAAEPDGGLTWALMERVPWIDKMTKNEQALRACAGLHPHAHRVAHAHQACARFPMWRYKAFHFCTQHLAIYMREDEYAQAEMTGWMNDFGDDLLYEQALEQQ